MLLQVHGVMEQAENLDMARICLPGGAKHLNGAMNRRKCECSLFLAHAHEGPQQPSKPVVAGSNPAGRAIFQGVTCVV